jgi:hypothetical protein
LIAHFRKLVLVVLLILSLRAFAVNGFFSLGYNSGGGSKLQDSTGGQSYNIDAGSGFLWSGGIVFPVSPTMPHRFEAQLGIGYMVNYSGGKDNEVDWTRVPLEAIYFYHNTREHFRLGWGPIYHMYNHITAKGSNSAAKMDVDNSWGWTFMAEMYAAPPVGKTYATFGLKYNVIQYKSPDFVQNAIGNAILVTLTMVNIDSVDLN